MTAVTKEPPTSIIVHETGEVKTVAFDMSAFLTEIQNPAHIAQQNKLAAAYDAACAAIIGPNDVQQEGARTFKKKSAWRKLARYFTISTRVVKVEREYLASGDFLATVTVEASAPWGQSAEAVGACCTDEATGRRVITVADAIATAETRATNRSTSNLIAMGEVSAEEMGDREPRGARAATATPAAPNRNVGEKKMPFGKHKGETLSTIDNKDLTSTVEWCREKDAEKFKDLIKACTDVMYARAQAGADQYEPDDDARVAGMVADDDVDDGLPF